LRDDPFLCAVLLLRALVVVGLLRVSFSLLLLVAALLVATYYLLIATILQLLTADIL
jgi:hypothetical protein